MDILHGRRLLIDNVKQMGLVGIQLDAVGQVHHAVHHKINRHQIQWRVGVALQAGLHVAIKQIALVAL